MKTGIIFLFLLLISDLSFGQGKIFKELNAAEFKAKLDAAKDNVVVLDVRTRDELSQGVISGATYLDYFQKDFEKQILKLDHDKTYFLYCASGVRSGETLTLMKKNGFKEAYNLKGGLAAWKKSKLPVEPVKK